jgi:hypothetical protein
LRSLFLIVVIAFSGCASISAGAPTRADFDRQAMWAANAGSVRTTGSGAQKVGLPLSRGGKIGLWTGVAVLLGYLMATDGEDGGDGTRDP